MNKPLGERTPTPPIRRVYRDHEYGSLLKEPPRHGWCDELVFAKEHDQAIRALTDQHSALLAQREALVNGCNAMLGLVQLLSHRDDLPPEVREVLRNNHRIDEAKAALNLVREASKEKP